RNDHLGECRGFPASLHDVLNQWSSENARQRFSWKTGGPVTCRDDADDRHGRKVSEKPRTNESKFPRPEKRQGRREAVLVGAGVLVGLVRLQTKIFLGVTNG